MGNWLIEYQLIEEKNTEAHLTSEKLGFLFAEETRRTKIKSDA